MIVSAAFGAVGALAQAPPTAVKVPAVNANIEFYLAHGEADACGRGCNEWIVAEGKIDLDAVLRLRTLLLKLGGRRPPLYVHSPGGSVSGSIALGRLIREQRLAVSVAHTVAVGCDRERLSEAACKARKRSGQAVDAEFDPTLAMCNSGCVLLVAAGVTRLVPPFVKLGIHDAGFAPDQRPPRGAAAAEALGQAHARIRAFLHDMGFDDQLFAAASAVPFASHRNLERDELVRFSIDRRTFGETVWQFTASPSPSMRKTFFVRLGSDPRRYLNGFVTLDCDSCRTCVWRWGAKTTRWRRQAPGRPRPPSCSTDGASIFRPGLSRRPSMRARLPCRRIRSPRSATTRPSRSSGSIPIGRRTRRALSI